MSLNQKARLRAAIQQFRAWADTLFPPEQRNGEWELEYQHWGDLHNSAIGVLGTDPSEWDEETKQLLTYAIARDSEVELLSERLTESQLFILAADSLRSDAWEAKWQFAKQLGKYSLTPEHENILLALVRDSDEYVRRRALIVLAEIGSAHAEQLAISAWARGGEYERMACLYALSRLRSPALSKYLELAGEDGQPHLISFAAHIRNQPGVDSGR